MQVKLPEVSEGKAGQHLVGEGAQPAGLLMRVPPFLILKLCHVGIIFVRLDIRQHPAFALPFPGLSTFALQRSLSLLQVPLAKCCGLSSTCSAHQPFASRYPLLTGFFHRHQDFLRRIMKVLIVLLLLSFLAIKFSTTNYSSLPG